MNRELKTGLYTFTGGLERLCVCGHPLGVHCATRMKYDGKTWQECFNAQSDGGTGEDCPCEVFKPRK